MKKTILIALSTIIILMCIIFLSIKFSCESLKQGDIKVGDVDYKVEYRIRNNIMDINMYGKKASKKDEEMMEMAKMWKIDSYIEIKILDRDNFLIASTKVNLNDINIKKGEKILIQDKIKGVSWLDELKGFTIELITPGFISTIK